MTLEELVEQVEQRWPWWITGVGRVRRPLGMVREFTATKYFPQHGGLQVRLRHVNAAELLAFIAHIEAYGSGV